MLRDIPDSASIKFVYINYYDSCNLTGFLDISKEIIISPKLQLQLKWTQILQKPNDIPHNSLGGPNL